MQFLKLSHELITDKNIFLLNLFIVGKSFEDIGIGEANL